MNAKTDSMEILPAMIAQERLRRADELVELAALARAPFSEDLVPSTDTPLRLAPRTADQIAEFWETLCYATLGLSALAGIGLCCF